MKDWKKLTSNQRVERVQQALNENVDFLHDISLGYPASNLDGKVFYDAPFLKDAPVLMTYVANPNHIGCHTTGTSETAFKGTQEIEREVLEIVAVDIFKSAKKQYDGYIATGGTEANIQALWIYRNFFQNTLEAKLSEIMIVASEDTHYSIAKGANLLSLDLMKVKVDFETRRILVNEFETSLCKAIADGKKVFYCSSQYGYHHVWFR